MGTAAPERVEPLPNEVMGGTNTPERDHRAMIKGVVQSVPQPPVFTAEQALPMAAAPIPASPELAQAGAHRVGSEELTISDSENEEMTHRDIKDTWKWVKGLFFGGVNKVRFAPAKIVSKIRAARISASAKTENKYDPSQMDIGQ